MGEKTVLCGQQHRFIPEKTLMTIRIALFRDLLYPNTGWIYVARHRA